MALERTRLLGVDPGPEVAEVEFVEIPVDGDVIAARRYRPAGEGRPVPAIVLFHGGAWWMGGGATGFELNDPLCRELCAGVGAVVLNVDYRLAPEHPYPVQHEDGLAAVRWVAETAAQCSVDPERIAVFGISSGGSLAAGLTVLARERGGPAIAAQVLMSPTVDFTATVDDGSGDPSLTAAINRLRAYYAADVEDWTIPHLSPGLAEDLSGLPPAIVITGEYDPLRPEAQAYVERLVDAGVEAVNLDYPMTQVIATPKVREAVRSDLLAELNRVLHG